MASRADVTSALTTCFAETDALGADLAADEWGVQSLCPDWDVKGVMTHLGGIEDLLLGWHPTTDDEPPPFQKAAEFARKVADMTGPELATTIRPILRRRRDELADMGDDQWAQQCMTPIGPATYGRFMEVRVFDFWVHQRDMTMPLGRATDDTGPAASIALDEVHQSLGYIVGKKIGLPDGMSIAFRVSGGLERDMFVVVDGRAAVVDHVDEPSVVVSADSTTFIMLACGRVDPQAEIDAGRIGWSGDDQWGETAACNLRFTM